jgi:quercetin dioxygenase-like cupin family protein
MSWTVKNLKEVDDAAVRFGLSPAMESRFARDDLGLERVGLSYQRLAPGARQPFAHRHGEHEEVYVILSGGGQVRLDDEVVEVGPLDAIRVSPETVRAFAGGPDGLEMLAFGQAGMGDAETLPPPEWPGVE